VVFGVNALAQNHPVSGTSPKSPSEWHNHLKGIFAGCTLSIILFLAAMNVILEFLSVCQSKTYTMGGLTELPPARAFMDDLCLMSTSTDDAQSLLNVCCKALSWAGMSFRASKSRSVVICSGKVQTMSPFYVVSSENDSKHAIPSITTLPVKFLGKVIHGSLSDKENVKTLRVQSRTLFSGSRK